MLGISLLAIGILFVKIPYKFLLTLGDGCELQLDSAAYVSTGNSNILCNETTNEKSILALPEKFESTMPNIASFEKLSICPTFSTFTFTGWSLEQEERLCEDGNVQSEKVMNYQQYVIFTKNIENRI